MIPPFAVSFSSSLRTRTRSCRGVIFAVISLTSVQSIPKLERSTFCGSRPTLRAKNLLILLPRHFQVVYLFFLALGFSFRTLLLFQFRVFHDGKRSFCIDSLGINDQSKSIREGRTDKIKGILRILPGRDGLLRCVIAVVLRRVDLRHNIRRRAILGRNGLHHVLRGKPFCGSSIVSHGNLIELAPVEGEKDLFDGIRLERTPGNVRRPPRQFLNQRWTAMNRVYIGHFLVSTLQHSGQGHSKGKVPILGKILCTKQWRRKKQNNKTENRTANSFHFRISYEFLSTRNQSHILPGGHFSAWSSKHSQDKILCRH